MRRANGYQIKRLMGFRRCVVHNYMYLLHFCEYFFLHIYTLRPPVITRDEQCGLKSNINRVVFFSFRQPRLENQFVGNTILYEDSIFISASLGTGAGIQVFVVGDKGD